MEQIADQSLFLLSVQITLAEWEALNAAIEHGMGGNCVEEKLSWFASVIVSFYKNATRTRNADKRFDMAKFDRTEAQEYIDEVMDQEFDTILEDDSTIQVVNKIFKYFVLSEAEKFEELRNQLSGKFAHVAKQQERLENAISQRKLTDMLKDVDMEEDSDGSDGEEQMDRLAEHDGEASTSAKDVQKKNKPKKSAREEKTQEMEDDGWSKVGKRR